MQLQGISRSWRGERRIKGFRTAVNERKPKFLAWSIRLSEMCHSGGYGIRMVDDNDNWTRSCANCVHHKRKFRVKPLETEAKKKIEFDFGDSGSSNSVNPLHNSFEKVNSNGRIGSKNPRHLKCPLMLRNARP